MNTQKIPTSHMLFFVIIIINYFSFLNIELFDFYNSISFYGNFVALMVIIIMNNKFNKSDQELIFYLLLFLSYGFLSLIITAGQIGSVITPIFSILTLWVFKKIKFDNRYLKIITIIMISLNLFWIISSPGYYQKFFMNKNDFLNSNTIGMILMYTSIYISIFIRRLDWKGARYISLAIHLFSGWGILNCEARGSFICLLVFVLFDLIIPKNIWRRRNIVLYISILIIIMGVFFTYIYVKMYINGYNYTIPFINKPLYTGREVIWLNFYFEITQSYKSLLFGLGSDAVLWSGNSLNLHNNYLTVLTNFGIVGYILYYSFWVKQIANVYKNNQVSDFQISLILGFITILVNGYFEVSMLWHNMFFFNFMFLGLAINSNSNDHRI